jgi:hypothetical protein
VVAELEQAAIFRVKATTNPNDRKAVINFIDFLFILNLPHSIENIARRNLVG